MTETAWTNCKKPDRMLTALKDIYGKMPVRKGRLFALACCDRVDHLITDPRSREAVDFATRHVETPVNRQKGRSKIEKAARVAHRDLYNEMFQFNDERSSACLVRSCSADVAVQIMNLDALHAARYSASFACFALAWNLMYAAKRSNRGNTLPLEYTNPEFEHQSRIVRDIFGNPFHPVAFDPAWRTPTAVGLARAIYDERAFDRLPILADALQDAGCEDADVLAHCCGNGPHVRGCWVVDLVLGKQ